MEKRLKINKKRNSGITIVALVITVVIMLILAGVTMVLVIADNGTINKSNRTKKQTIVEQEKEAIAIAYNGAVIENNNDGIFVDNINNHFNINKTSAIAKKMGDKIRVDFETGRSYVINIDGTIEEYIDIEKYVKVGDYVSYNPTVKDKYGKTKVEARKLNYSSPIGNAIEHGNGESKQSFTATENVKWQILNIENENIELISENIIQTNQNSNFILKGAIGYLYAEQELNEICKIYGYGYGANLTKGGVYTVGGPLDDVITKKIDGTGARSITIEDINNLAGIYEENGTIKYSNGKTVNEKYGNNTDHVVGIYYPTIDLNKGIIENGKSKLGNAKGLTYTWYMYNKSQIKNEEVKNMLFNGDYWMSSRCIVAESNGAYHYVRHVIGGNTNVHYLCYGNTADLNEFTIDKFAVRPIVTLKSEVIDINTDYRKEGKWNLK